MHQLLNNFVEKQEKKMLVAAFDVIHCDSKQMIYYTVKNTLK